MRKIKVVIMIFIGFFIIPQMTGAVDYSIEETTIDVYLQEDGDVFVSEQFTYDFSSAFNGMIRTLHPKEHTSITKIVATENDQALVVEQDGHDYLIYRQGENETVTVNFSYTIEGGVDLYKDVGEFYWSFFDKNNPTDYDRVTITVYPPTETTDVIALGYEIAEGIAKVLAKGEVEYSFGAVDAGVGANIRVAYDHKLFPEASLTKDQSMKDELIAEQKEQAEAKEMFVKRQRQAKNIAPYMIALFGAYFLILVFYAWRKKRQLTLEIERRYPLPFFVPEQTLSLPATILYMRGLLTGDAVTAALFDLVRKGYVTQKEETIFIAQHKNVEHFHEKHLINWLFDTIGTDGRFQPGDLEAYVTDEKNQEQYHEDYQTWQQAVHEELTSHNLRENNRTTRIIIGLSGLLLVPFIIYLAIYEQLVYGILGGFLLLAIWFFALLYRPRTLLGEKIKQDWRHFQNNYQAIEQADWQALRDDEQRRAFIYSLGMNDPKMVKKNERLIHETNTNIFPGVDLSTLLIMSAFMNAQFNHANDVSAQSAGGTGVYTGTGVGGSGGGSSAF